MTTYGDTQEPGVVTELTSSAAVSTSGAASNDIGYVGQADLANAKSPADTSKVYEVTRASKAVEWFGPKSSSLLTQAVIDALNEGAYPVYAVATDETVVSGEDHSDVSDTSISLDNAPIREDEESISVTLDSTDLTVHVVRDNATSYSPEAGECYINPVRGKFEINTTPSTSLTVDYEHFDYMNGIDVLKTEAADVVDYFVPLSENDAVVDDAKTTVAKMEKEYNLALLHGGADIYIDPNNVSGFSQSYDDSRTQTIYPTRFADGTSALAAYSAYVSTLGLGETPINKRLNSEKALQHTLDKQVRGLLGDKNVVVLANETRGVRITDDHTTVSEDNTDEKNLNYGFNRRVADYIIETTRDNQKPFIGKLNSQTVRNTLEGMVADSLTELQESNAVISYEINVLKEDAVTAGLEMKVKLTKPLRFIENTVTVSENQ